MADKRLKLFPAPAVVRVKQLHSENFSQRVATILDRYQGLLDYHQSPLSHITDAERKQIADCLQGSVVDAMFVDCLDQELSDSGFEDLAIKIEQLSYADKLILIESLGCELALG